MRFRPPGMAFVPAVRGGFVRRTGAGRGKPFRKDLSP